MNIKRKKQNEDLKGKKNLLHPRDHYMNLTAVFNGMLKDF